MSAASGSGYAPYSGTQLSEEERARQLERERRKQKWLVVGGVLFLAFVVGALASSITGGVRLSAVSLSISAAISVLIAGIITFVTFRQRARFENRAKYLEMLKKIDEEGRSRYTTYR